MRLALLIPFLFACTGEIADPAGRPPEPTAPPIEPEDRLSLSRTGVRRLSRTEYRDTILDLTGVDIAARIALLPEDPQTPFDNDYAEQVPSAALVEGLKALADAAADAIAADPDARARLRPCMPTGPDDAACMEAFVRSFGRRAIRRPLADDEVAAYTGAALSIAMENGTFWDGADVVIRAFLQDPELVYRIEIGTPVEGDPGVVRLGPYELASRLSFLIWGTGPDDALLDAAAAGELDGDAIVSVATRMLADPRARTRITRLHAMWLGYDSLPHGPELAAAMRRETDALVERVVFDERRSWIDVFRMEETFVDDRLAEHYGLPTSGSTEPRWVSYGETGRRGILSHGSVLSNGAAGADTSPVQRGKFIRERLLCDEIPPPPPSLMVDVDAPLEAGPDACKPEIYAMHRSGGCAACHGLMDPVGFGLERYDLAGRYRTVEPTRPHCEIEGRGTLSGLGEFEGPAGLAELIVETPRLSQCFVTQLFRFAAGRREAREDLAELDALAAEFRGSDHDLLSLILQLVRSEGFRLRRIDAAPSGEGEMP